MTGGGTAGGGTGSGGPPPTLSAYRGLRLTGGRVRVDRGSITTKVFCSSSAVSRCAGTIYLERRVRKGKRFATIRLGRARAAVRAGRTASLRMRVSLSRKDLKLVHRSKLKLVLRSATRDSRPGTTSVTTRKTVTLIPRRAKKGK